MNEREFYKKLRSFIGPDFHFQRIESPLTAQGIPDLVYHKGKTTGFIELKYIKKFPARPETVLKIGITKLQKSWLTRWKNAGANCFVIVGIMDKIWVFDNFYKLGEMETIATSYLAKACLSWDDYDRKVLREILENGHQE